MSNAGNHALTVATEAWRPEVLFADAHLLAVAKPYGLLCVPGKGTDLADCLSTRLRQFYPNALVVHRLDRDTSGVMVFALSAAAQRELGRQFEQRQVQKQYAAIVTGQLSAKSGEIDLPLAKDFDNPPRRRVDFEHGKAALTRWQVVSSDALTTRLRLSPTTGRSHQLRVHLSHIGNPIVGDPLYGQATQGRMLLHAEQLQLSHPTTGTPLCFDCAAPF